jgi:hypothetical protein
VKEKVDENTTHRRMINSRPSKTGEEGRDWFERKKRSYIVIRIQEV